MSEAKLWKWEDNAEVVLMWSEKDDTIQAIVTTNGRVMLQARISEIESFHTFQTFLNEMGIEIKIAGTKYKFIGTKESKYVWYVVPFLSFAYTSLVVTFSAAAREKQIGISSLRQALLDNHVKVTRSTYPRTIALSILVGIFISLAIVGVRIILNI